MVVQCQSCQARFRVADDKVTDRGVRVRCTGCRTVFLVRKDGSQSALQQTAPTGDTVLGMAPLQIKPTGPAPASRPAPVKTSPPPPPIKLAPPPSAAPRNGAARRSASDDPFGMDELTGDSPKPLASRPAASKQPKPGLGARPTLDPLSDLDVDEGASLARPVVTPPPPPPIAGTDTPSLSIGTLKRRAIADEPQAPQIGDAGSKPPPPPPLWEDEESSGERAQLDESEEPEAAAPPPPRPSAKSGMRDDPFVDLELEHGTSPDVPLRASDPALPKVAMPGAQSPAGRASRAAPAPVEEPPVPRSARRQIVSSALTGLVGAALALLIAVGPAAFSDAGLRTLMGASELVVVQEASGLYDTAAGKPVYFVRGHIENRGRRVDGPVRVVATLVMSSGATAARAETTAGVEIGPEDVLALRSAADAEKLARSLAQKSDRRLPPGGTLPFVAVFTDPPTDLAGHRVQLRLDTAETATTR